MTRVSRQGLNERTAAQLIARTHKNGGRQAMIRLISRRGVDRTETKVYSGQRSFDFYYTFKHTFFFLLDFDRMHTLFSNIVDLLRLNLITFCY